MTRALTCISETTYPSLQFAGIRRASAISILVGWSWKFSRAHLGVLSKSHGKAEWRGETLLAELRRLASAKQFA